MPKYAENYEELINELRLQLEELTTERDELRAENEALKTHAQSLNEKMCWWKGEENKRTAELSEAKARISELEADAFCDDEENFSLEIEVQQLEQQLSDLKAKLEGGVRVLVGYRNGQTVIYPKGETFYMEPNATLILDDGAEI